jgi:hypothetical protein
LLGGGPRVRSDEFLDGLPGLPAHRRAEVDLGNKLGDLRAVGVEVAGEVEQRMYLKMQLAASTIHVDIWVKRSSTYNPIPALLTIADTVFLGRRGLAWRAH